MFVDLKLNVLNCASTIDIEQLLGFCNSIIIIIAEMAVFYVAGYLIEERRRWPVITASPRGQHSKYIQNFERKAHSDEKTVPVAWLD